jgi:hypothetical protein
VNSEIERIWKEAAVAYLPNYTGICLEELTKAMKNLIQDSW